jgi:GTPase
MNTTTDDLMFSPNFKAGFVSILGKPNAGKSTLLNAILDEKLAIVSHKVQTTRHRIMGIWNEGETQIVFSDTPGIIEPKYLMHKRMMSQVSGSVKDADVILFMFDVKDDLQEATAMLTALHLKVPTIVVANKIDTLKNVHEEQIKTAFAGIKNCASVIFISAIEKDTVAPLIATIQQLIPVHPPYYNTDELSDRPMKFFVSEMIREQIFLLLNDELPYHSAVLVEKYEEKNTLTKIIASIIVTRETQKGIMLGKGGEMIKKIGSQSRLQIEQFIDRKVFLELHVKVRADWRTKDNFLNEYGY